MLKKYLFMSCAVFMLLSTALYAQKPDSTEASKMDPQAAKYYNTSMELMKAGKFEEAAPMLDSCLLSYKDHLVYFYKGVALSKTDKKNEAKEAFQASITLNPNYDQSYYRLANMLLAQKEYDAAAANYEKVISITKDEKIKSDAAESMKYCTDAKAIDFFNKGNDLVKAGKFDEAVASFDQALTISKDYKTYYQKGLAQMKALKFEEAKATLLQCVAVKDSFDVAHIALAGVSTQLKDYEGAVSSYEKALAVTKDEGKKTAIKEGIAKTYLTLGNAAYKDKKLDKAIENFNKSIEKSEIDLAYVGLAKALGDKKQYDKAFEALDNAAKVKKQVTDGGLAYNKALIYLAKGDNKNAIAQFTIGLSDPLYKKACDSQIKFLQAKAKQAQSKTAK